MAIDLIGNNRFSQCAIEPSVVDMTTYSTPTHRGADPGPTDPSAFGPATPGLGPGGDAFRESSRRSRAVVPRALSDAGAAALARDGGCGGRRGGGRDIGSQLLGGWLGDRIGRRHTMLVGFLGTAVALVALGSADTVPAIWAAAVGVGLMAELFRPAGSAAVADLPQGQRVRAFGLLFWAASLGFSFADGHRRNPRPTRVRAPVLDQRHGLDRRGTDRLAPGARDPSADVEADPASTAAGSPARPTDDRHGRDLRRLLHTVPADVRDATARDDGRRPRPATYGAVLALNGIVIVVVQPIAVRLLDGSRPQHGAGRLDAPGRCWRRPRHHRPQQLPAMPDRSWSWTLGEIGIAVMFGATFADLAPADLRGRYMGVASTTWSVGAVLGPLVGTAAARPRRTNRAGGGVCRHAGLLSSPACRRSVRCSGAEPQAGLPSRDRAPTSTKGETDEPAGNRVT